MFRIFGDIKMTTVEVNVKPLKFKRTPLKRCLFIGTPFVDYKHPVNSLAGFSVTETEFNLLELYKIFTDIKGTLLGQEERIETSGEKKLGCARCVMRKANVRPYLSPRDERYTGLGLADIWTVLCPGLMALNRLPDSEIPCLKVLKGKEPIKLQFDVMEG